MNKTEYELEEIIDNANVDLDKAIRALEEFEASYDWEVYPSADKANKYGSYTNREDCPKDEEISWKLLYEYDRIRWLIQIAHDYLLSASSTLQKKDK